jgi:N6-L-threonylcarbamoyladenine synthase
MIAIVGYLKYLENDYSNQNTSTTARLKVNEG